MMSLCYVAVLLFNAPANAPGQSEGMVVELKALEARQALRNGVVEVLVETLRMEGPNGAALTPPPVELKITFDGKKRIAESREHGNHPPERRTFDGNRYFHESGDKTEAERIIIDSHALARMTQYLIDPRPMGIYCSTFGLWKDDGLDTVLGRTDRTDESVKQEQMSGHNVLHVSRKLMSGQLQSDLWIAPELNHSIVKCVVVTANFGRSELVAEYDKPFDGAWFPTRTTYRSYRAQDDQLRDEQVVTVKSAVFNRGIDPSLFTLAAFKPGVGDIVRQDGAQMAWNGKHLVSADDATVATLKSRSLIGNWPWFTVAVFLAIAAFVMLRVRRTPNLFAKGAES